LPKPKERASVSVANGMPLTNGEVSEDDEDDDLSDSMNGVHWLLAGWCM
jgi:hypothetical protein